MTDENLISLAAKAAGINGEFDSQGRFWSNALWEEFDTGYWNPLCDDGEAFRLAINLNIDIAAHGEAEDVPAAVCYYDFRGVYGYSVKGVSAPIMEDKCAAYRRAIVLAAAEIGKHMRTTVQTQFATQSTKNSG